MRDPGVIDALDALDRYARAFDAISGEQDARYSARGFVRWVRLETTVERRPMEATDGSNADGPTATRVA
jgi:hypothetical protein